MHEYRRAALEACHAVGFTPVTMEYFEAMGNGVTHSARQKIDKADLFVGFWGHRYGFIDDGSDHSIAEFEYRYAGERGLDRLCFLMDMHQPWRPALIDFEFYPQLAAFKRRLAPEDFCDIFGSVDNFRIKLLQALVAWREQHPIVKPSADSQVKHVALTVQHDEVTFDIDRFTSVLATLLAIEHNTIELVDVGDGGHITIALPNEASERLLAMDESYPDLLAQYHITSIQPVIEQQVFHWHLDDGLPYIYLSYDDEDTSLMRRVRKALRASGLKVWTEDDVPESGVSWKSAAEHVINSAAGVVALFSSAAQNSQWMRSELQYAVSRGHFIIPVLLEDEPDDTTTIPDYLGQTQWADLRGDFDSGVQDLIETIYAHLADSQPLRLKALQPSTTEAGVMAMQLGNYEQAIAYYEQAIIISRGLNDRRGEEAALANLGMAHAALSQPNTAMPYLQEALALAHRLGDLYGEIIILNNMNDLFVQLGQYDSAVEDRFRVLTLARKIGDRLSMANALRALGDLYRSMGRPKQSVNYYRQAREVYATLDLPHHVESVDALINTVGEGVSDSLRDEG